MQYRGMKDLLDFFTSRERLFNFFDNRHLLDWMPDEKYLKMAFRAKMGYPLNLENPKTFNEKLQWLKLHDRKPLYTTLVDKYAVRQYIADKIGEEYLIPLVGGPWNSADEIDFDSLPEQFVLKCNHDSGSVVICRDKSKFDIEAVKRKLNNNLKTNYYKSGREWPYKDVKPCIVAEEYLEETGISETITDYKFFCFDGNPRMMYLSSDGAAEPRTDFFDMEFNHIPIRMRDENSEVKPKKPEAFETMKSLAKTLSENIAHVRVDFYVVNKKIYFGEMTFYHNGGFVHVNPPKWDETIGSWIELPTKE